jgi:hypothetical protein
MMLNGWRMPLTQRWEQHDGARAAEVEGPRSMTAPNQLAYFTATATILDIEQPNPDGTSVDPQLLDVSAFVNFFPGTENGVFPQGFGLQVANLDPTGADAAGSGVNAFVPLAPITGRLMNGQLTSIAINDPVGVGLLANSPFLDLSSLFWHIQFTNVTFGGATQALDNFAIQAPTTAATVDLFAETTTHFPYFGPS